MKIFEITSLDEFATPKQKPLTPNMQKSLDKDITGRLNDIEASQQKIRMLSLLEKIVIVQV